MKEDAMKGREMDERTARLLNVAKAADQELSPLKPILERLKPLREALDKGYKAPSVPVVTDCKPLRDPGYQSRESGAPLPPLELRTSQNTEATSTKTTPRSNFPNNENEKQRTTNLERAVRAAMESMHRSTGQFATLDELIQYLKESDETGHILGAIGDEVAWSNTKGEKSTTGRRGIQKHWKKYATTR
jgi:hypothetical protein